MKNIYLHLPKTEWNNDMKERIYWLGSNWQILGIYT